MATDFKHIFQPIQIGTMTLKNRLVMPAMGTRYSQFGGWISDQLIDYLSERAKGGVGLVTVEMAAVTFSGRISNYSPGIYDDRLIPGLEKLTAAVQRAGAKVAIQLAHGGAGSGSLVTGVQPVAPSPVARFKGETPRELSIKEIESLVKAFAMAAKKARRAGFDAIEIHMAHGYLIDQFLSPLTNTRSDPYGGDVNGRAKFAVDILRSSKEAAGADYPVICRLTGDQFMDEGFTIKESKIVAKLLENAGADALHVTGGNIETIYMSAPPMAVPEGCLVSLAEQIKQTVQIPVIAVGKVRTPSLADEIIKTERADLVAVGRGLIADPEFPQKAFDNRASEIRPCISCNNPQCHGRTIKNLDMGCLVNPTVGRERRSNLVKTDQSKKILIVGAGPAGLEAARVSALRGHHPILCEKASDIGGQLRFGCVPPHKEELQRLINYYAVQLEKLNVALKTECEVTSEVVNELNPDAIFIASGGKYAIPEIKHVTSNAVFAADVLAQKVSVGKTVVIIGGGDVGCETAEYLAQNGKQVTILEMMPEAASEYMWWSKKLLYDRLAMHAVSYMTSTKVIEVGKGYAIYERGGILNRIDAVDTFVLATGLEANTDMESTVKDLGIPYYVMGDSRNPGNISTAIREGFESALTI